MIKKKTKKKVLGKKPAQKKPGKSRRVKPKKSARVSRVLSAGEPKPFRLENTKGAAPGLIICDHSSSRVPKSLKNMGLGKADLRRHIGWDIGTEDISCHLGKALDMPVVLAGYSRLVVDLNRAPRHPESMIEVSDCTPVPANNALSKQAREQRLREIYRPYQTQIAKQVDRLVKKARLPVLVAIHSFTPEMGGVKRPWHIAILWNQQEKIAKTIIANLRKNHPGLLVGENEPYSLKDERFKDSTINRHAEDRDLPYVFVEFRQDLVDTREKAIHWADIFLQAVKPVLENVEAHWEGGAKLPKK